MSDKEMAAATVVSLTLVTALLDELDEMHPGLMDKVARRALELSWETPAEVQKAVRAHLKTLASEGGAR